MSLPRFFFNIDSAHLMWNAPPISLEQFLHEILGATQGTQVDNEVNLILHERPDDIAPPFTLYVLRLEIKYNILPMGLARIES